jgi:hypothetical protein
MNDNTQFAVDPPALIIGSGGQDRNLASYPTRDITDTFVEMVNPNLDKSNFT